MSKQNLKTAGVDAYTYYCSIAQVNSSEVDTILHDNQDGTMRMLTREEFDWIIKNAVSYEALPQMQGYVVGDIPTTTEDYKLMLKYLRHGID